MLLAVAPDGISGYHFEAVPIETPLGALQTLDELVAAVIADPDVAQRLSCPVMMLIAPMDLWMRTTDPRADQPARPGVTMLPMFVVRVTTGDGGLAKRPVLLGRGEEADIPLAFSALSKRHALFHPPGTSGGGWKVEDVGSRNGIFVEGTKIPLNSPVELPDGTRLRFGNIVGRFVLPEAMRADLLARAKR